jgi:hypothetical protein
MYPQVPYSYYSQQPGNGSEGRESQHYLQDERLAPLLFPLLFTAAAAPYYYSGYGYGPYGYGHGPYHHYGYPGYGGYGYGSSSYGYHDEESS